MIKLIIIIILSQQSDETIDNIIAVYPIFTKEQYMEMMKFVLKCTLTSVSKEEEN